MNIIEPRVHHLAATQPDVTLLLDRDGVIQQATLSQEAVGEQSQAWLGRSWAETLIDLPGEEVRRFLDSATDTGVSAFGPVRQSFPSGLELPMEYTAVRLGKHGSLLAVGKCVQAVLTLQSRLLAAQQARAQESWRLREVETRYRVLFDATNDAVLVLQADTLRVADANPAALRSFGFGAGHDLLAEMAPSDRAAVLDLLARVRSQGRAPGILVHVGAAYRAWTLRASVSQTEQGSLFLLQFTGVGAEPESARNEPKLRADAYIERLPAGAPVMARLGTVPLSQIVQEATEAIERDCIAAALAQCGGNRSAAAILLGLSRQSLYAKLHRYGLHRLGAEGVDGEAEPDQGG